MTAWRPWLGLFALLLIGSPAGARQQNMCLECGAKIGPHADQCPRCGAWVDLDDDPDDAPKKRPASKLVLVLVLAGMLVGVLLIVGALRLFFHLVNEAERKRLAARKPKRRRPDD